MIPIPPHAIRGQVLTADFLNRILDALRAVRPIQGQGILLRETVQGVIIEATAKAAKAAPSTPLPPATHQPFELRVRVEPDGTAHWLDIYDPQGAYTRFLDSATQIRNTYPSGRSASHPLTDVGGGWYAVANLDDATFVNGKATLYVVFANMNGDIFRFEFTSNNVTEPGRIAVGIVTRTVGETTAYAIQQIVLGAFFADYAWDGAEAVMTQKDGGWTADLTGVEWTPTTPLILARLYSRTLVFAARPQGPLTLAHPCAEIPLGLEDTLPCFAAKIDATPHAADHIQDFIPFAEENA